MTKENPGDNPSDWSTLNLDDRGYLLDRSQWQHWVAEQMASRDDLVLSEQHWEILTFLQDYYDNYQMAPPMRVLVKAIAIQLGQDKAESRYLYRLFPDGPAKQACRYAGLPKPVSCV